MKSYKFKMLKQLDDQDDFSKKLRTGDLFLYGMYMKQQVEVKQPGDTISYFKVLKIDGTNVEYVLIHDELEKDPVEREL